jgi:hypothetical protein
VQEGAEDVPGVARFARVAQDLHRRAAAGDQGEEVALVEGVDDDPQADPPELAGDLLSDRDVVRGGDELGRD